jgi:hypothetical protein
MILRPSDPDEEDFNRHLTYVRKTGNGGTEGVAGVLNNRAGKEEHGQDARETRGGRLTNTSRSPT